MKKPSLKQIVSSGNWMITEVKKGTTNRYE